MQSFKMGESRRITAIIDSRGHFNGMTQIFREAVLTGEIRPGSGGTLYDRFGDLFAILCLTGTALLGLYAIIQLRKSKEC